MSGYPAGTFKPAGNITRAEAVAALNKVLTAQNVDQDIIYNEAGVFGPNLGQTTIAKNVIVKADGITLQNIVIKGNLIIAEEVGDGDVTLNNIIVEGQTFIRGGGKDSIHMNGGNYNAITIQKTSSGSVRIVATNLEGVEFIISEAASGEEIILEGNFDRVTIDADDVNVATQGETNIKEFIVKEGVRDVFVNLGDDSVVSKLVVDAKTVVQGQGSIIEATGEKLRSSTFEKAPEGIVISTGSSRIEVRSVTITGEAIVGTSLTAVRKPSSATVNYQWKISPDGGTYTNITGAISSTYTPVPGDVGKFIRVEVTGIENYKGTITSNAAGSVIPARAQTATAAASALTPAAGAAGAVTLTVKDALGGVDARFGGVRAVTISGAEPAPFGTYGSFNGTALTADSITGQIINVTF